MLGEGIAIDLVGAVIAQALAILITFHVETETADTIADGVAVRVPVPEAVADMRGLVEDVVLVDDDTTRRAMELTRRHAGLIVEPAGVLGVAAILKDPDRYKDRSIATILCGSNAQA